jgi:hypothetical protein
MSEYIMSASPRWSTIPSSTKKRSLKHQRRLAQAQLKHRPKQPFLYTREEQEVSDNTFRDLVPPTERVYLTTAYSGQNLLDTFISKPGNNKNKKKKKRRRCIPTPVPKKDKDRVSMAERIDDSDDSEDNAPFSTAKPANPNSPSLACRPSSSNRKMSRVANRRKSIGTPVPTTLEGAHPTDKELFRMKADGKPWKRIKPVREKPILLDEGKLRKGRG